MSFKVIKHGDVWIVAKPGPGVEFSGGIAISYAEYKLLRDTPHEAHKYFKVDAKGKLEPIAQTSPLVDD